MWSVIFPQALKNCLPTYTSEFIVLVKETAVVGYIALTDLTKVLLRHSEQDLRRLRLFHHCRGLFLHHQGAVHRIFQNGEEAEGK